MFAVTFDVVSVLVPHQTIGHSAHLIFYADVCEGCKCKHLRYNFIFNRLPYKETDVFDICL